MRKILLFIAALSTLVLASGCNASSDTSTVTATSTVTSTPKPSHTETTPPDPTNSPASSDPRSATDNLLVNTTINHLLDQDIEALTALVKFNQQGCTTADGLGGPPKCQEGVQDGTLITFLPALGPGEGSYLEPAEVERAFDYQDPQLYRVILIETPENIDPVFPEGSYAVVLAIEPNGFARTFRLSEEGFIVRVDYTVWSPKEESDRIIGEVLFTH